MPFSESNSRKVLLCTDSEINPRSEVNSNDRVAKFPVLRYLRFTKYICIFSAGKKSTSAREGRVQASPELFWVVFWGECWAPWQWVSLV